MAYEITLGLLLGPVPNKNQRRLRKIEQSLKRKMARLEKKIEREIESLETEEDLESYFHNEL